MVQTSDKRFVKPYKSVITDIAMITEKEMINEYEHRMKFGSVKDKNSTTNMFQEV